jgi:hypothetical protein
MLEYTQIYSNISLSSGHGGQLGEAGKQAGDPDGRASA